jgi:succinyl-CoA synthetase beta subunit
VNLIEFEAKTLLRDAGLPVPAGTLVGAQDAPGFQDRCVLKAQIADGGRAKRGLILPVGTPADGPAQLELLRQRLHQQGHGAAGILMEEAMQAQQECYFAWSIDDVAQGVALSFSPSGGVDVEANAHNVRRLVFAPSHEPRVYEFVGFFAAAGFDGRTLAALCRFASATWHVFIRNDAQLLEVNPLAVLAGGDVVALDAKLVLDDSARPRHGEWARLRSSTIVDERTTELERRAARGGFTFVELDGEIAVFAGGAGIGMAILDALADAGMPAANFADASGGSGADMFESLGRLTFERATRSDVRAILMYFTLAATSVASVVEGVLRLLDHAPPPKPLIIGLLTSGAAEREMTFSQARAAFASRGLRCESGLDGVLSALAQLRRLPHPLPTEPA